jgi:hypothetical protein
MCTELKRCRWWTYARFWDWALTNEMASEKSTRLILVSLVEILGLGELLSNWIRRLYLHQSKVSRLHESAGDIIGVEPTDIKKLRRLQYTERSLLGNTKEQNQRSNDNHRKYTRISPYATLNPQSSCNSIFINYGV